MVVPSSSVNSVCDSRRVSKAVVPSSTVKLRQLDCESKLSSLFRIRFPRPADREKESKDISECKPAICQTSLHSRGAKFWSKFQSPMWSEEVVMTSENVQLLFEEFLKPSEAGCSSGQERSRLSDRQVEAFDEGGVEGFGILWIQECLFEIPFVSNDHSTIHFGDAIISSGFDYLGIEAFSEALANSALIKFISVGGNEWNTLWICKFWYWSYGGFGVVVIPGSNDCPRPKARPDIHGGKDPWSTLFGSSKGTDFIGLDLSDIHFPCVVLIKLLAGFCCFFQPSMNRVPSNRLDSGYGWFVNAFNTQTGHLIELRSGMLYSEIRSSGGGWKCGLADLASKPSAFSGLGFVISVRGDFVCGFALMTRAFLIGTGSIHLLRGWQ